MSFKPEFEIEGKWCTNGQAFATQVEAERSALDRFQRWYVPTGYRAVESEEAVNYVWVEGEGDKRCQN